MLISTEGRLRFEIIKGLLRRPFGYASDHTPLYTSGMQTVSTNTEQTKTPLRVPETGPLPDTARTVSMLAGGATLGAVVGGPVGAIVGGVVGAALGLGATGHLRPRD